MITKVNSIMICLVKKVLGEKLLEFSDGKELPQVACLEFLGMVILIGCYRDQMLTWL